MGEGPGEAFALVHKKNTFVFCLEDELLFGFQLVAD